MNNDRVLELTQSFNEIGQHFPDSKIEFGTRESCKRS